MSLPFLNNSFYGIPLGIYAMIGVTTGVLAIMTINDSSQSSASAPMFELPNILSSDKEPVKEDPEPVKEELAPVEEVKPEEENPVEEENKLIGGKKIDGKKIDGKKKRKTRRNKSKSDLKKPNKKTKRK